MTPQECRAKAAEMREYGRNHPQFAKEAERIVAAWEKAAFELEVGEASTLSQTVSDGDQTPGEE